MAKSKKKSVAKASAKNNKSANTKAGLKTKSKSKTAGKVNVSKKAASAKISKPVGKKAVQQGKVKDGNPKAPSLKTNTWPTSTLDKNKKSESFFKNYLKPLDDRIVVLVNKAEKKTAGGLYIPDTVTDVSGNFQGKVMAIGRGHMNKKGKVKPLDVSVGDSVVFSQFSGSQVDVDGNDIMVIRESDVLGIVK